MLPLANLCSPGPYKTVNNLVVNIGSCNCHLVLKQCSSFSKSIFPIICSNRLFNKFSVSTNQNKTSSVRLKFKSHAEICVILLEGTPNTVKQNYNLFREPVKLQCTHLYSGYSLNIPRAPIEDCMIQYCLQTCWS